MAVCQICKKVISPNQGTVTVGSNTMFHYRCFVRSFLINNNDSYTTNGNDDPFSMYKRSLHVDV